MFSCLFPLLFSLMFVLLFVVVVACFSGAVVLVRTCVDMLVVSTYGVASPTIVRSGLPALMSGSCAAWSRPLACACWKTCRA